MQKSTLTWDNTSKNALSAAIEADMKKLVEEFVQTKALDKLKSDAGSSVRKAAALILKGRVQFDVTVHELTPAGLRERKEACKDAGSFVVSQVSFFTSSEGSVDATLSAEVIKNLGFDVSYDEVVAATLKSELEEKLRAVVRQTFASQTFVAAVGFL